VVSHVAGWSPRILRNNQDERGAMIQIDDDIRKLVTQLIAASRSRSGAKLNPKSVDVALAALRACLEKPASRPVTTAIVSFQIEALDNIGLPAEVLATTGDKRIAHTTLARAKARFPDRMITLRGKSSSGERIRSPD
jgi:hypothetical protein